MPTIEVSDETYEKIKKQFATEIDTVDLESLDSLIGQKWFFRTVTYHLVGLVEKRLGSFLVLKDASWVADSGRFMDAIKNGKLSEVEPVGVALVNLNSVTDAFPWKHALPKDQK
jgi:hypothetical protein